MYFIGLLAILCLPLRTRAEMLLNHGKIVVCPTRTQSGILREGINDFKITETDWGAFCTHIIIIENYKEHEITSHKINEDLMQITGLKTKYTRLKISLTACAIPLYRMYIKPRDTGDFFTKYIAFLTAHKFDGVDVMFDNLEITLDEIEHMSKDINDFFAFLTQFKRVLNDNNLFITMTFSSTLEFTENSSYITKYVKMFEFVHICRLSGQKGKAKNTFGHAVIDSSPPILMQTIVNLFSIWGIAPSKIVLGVNFNGLAAKTNRNGDIMNANVAGSFSYYSACEYYTSRQLFEKKFDEDKQMIHLTIEVKNEDAKWVCTYPTTKTIANFMKFMVQVKLAGTMATCIYFDDYKGNCQQLDNDTFDDFNQTLKEIEIPKRPDSKFPYIRTVHEAIYKAVRGTIRAQPATPLNIPEASNAANQSLPLDVGHEGDGNNSCNGNEPFTGGASSFLHNAVYNMSFVFVGIIFSTLLSI